MRIITQTNTLPGFGSTFKTSTPKQTSNYEESIYIDPALLLDDGEDSYEEHKNALEVAEAVVRETSAGGWPWTIRIWTVPNLNLLTAKTMVMK